MLGGVPAKSNSTVTITAVATSLVVKPAVGTVAADGVAALEGAVAVTVPGALAGSRIPCQAAPAATSATARPATTQTVFGLEAGRSLGSGPLAGFAFFDLLMTSVSGCCNDYLSKLRSVLTLTISRTQQQTPHCA